MVQKKLIDFLLKHITPERALLFEKILQQRTSYITVVLEDIFQPQNASAVLRTCDCFGIQNVHVIENRNTFTIDREVAMGASKWLSIHKYNESACNSLDAIRSLKSKGYRIVATTPHSNDLLLPEFDVAKGKAALVFGSELPGISEGVLNEADEYVKIPMSGFTESFNISVSAAIILFHLTEKMKQSADIDWHLTSEEKEEVMLQWLRNTIKKSKLLEERFYHDNAINPDTPDPKS